MNRIAVINESTVVKDDDIIAMLPDMQEAIYAHFYPVWGEFAYLQFFKLNQTPPSDWWVCLIMDNIDVPSALAYHDVTATGQPVIKIGAKADIDSGSSLSVTITHEIFEALGDPVAALMVMDATGRIIAYENCDAVEDDSMAFTVGKTKISNFVYPSWFEGAMTPGPYDHQGLVQHPGQILQGGYIGVYDCKTGWSQATQRSRSDQRWKIRQRKHEERLKNAESDK